MARYSYSGRRAASRRAAASAIRGSKTFRRIVRQLPDAMRKQLVGVLESGGRTLLAIVRARTPRRTGALVAGESYKVYPKALKLRVGLLGTKRGRAKLFYGFIQDRGRRAQTVTVTRKAGLTGLRGNNRNGNTRRGVYAGKPYLLRVRAMAGKRFVTGRQVQMRNIITSSLRGIWDGALRQIAGSSADD